MPLTKDKREALQIARTLIANGRQHFICHALKEVAHWNPSLTNACKELRVFVQEALGGRRYTLEAWQTLNSIRRHDGQGRQDRLAWLDWMLNEPENEIA